MSCYLKEGMNVKSSTFKSKTENCIQTSLKIQKWLYDFIFSNINPKKKERNNFTKAFHFTVKELQQKIEELTSENASLKNEKLSISDYLHEKGLSPKQALHNDMSMVESIPTEIPEKPCEFRVFVDRDPKCGDPDAPIDSYLKRHINAQICALCQKLKKKALAEKEKEAKRKQDEETKRFREKTKKQASFYANRINDTVQQQKTNRRTEVFTNEFGERITP